MVSGTFSATGASQPIVSASWVAISMTFSGTATVDAEWSLDNGQTWEAVDTFTEGPVREVFFVPGIPFRLNCTAYTNSVAYKLKAVGK